MAINFPNPSRSFDAIKSRVSFWGYDSVIEIAFSVESAALVKLYPGAIETEEGYLKAFDAVHEKIHQVAEGVYNHGRGKGAFSFNLAAEDFKSN